MTEASVASTKKRRATDPVWREEQAAKKRAARAAMTPEQAAVERARLDAARDRHVAADALRRAQALAADCTHHVDAHRAHVATERQRIADAAAAFRAADRAHIPPGAGPNRIKKLRRQHAVRRATPAWADRTQIQAMYDVAKVMSEAAGVEFTVDHIVPLRHPLVCGLHVPANLSPATRRDNSRKGNFHWPDQPCPI